MSPVKSWRWWKCAEVGHAMRVKPSTLQAIHAGTVSLFDACLRDIVWNIGRLAAACNRQRFFI